jgi:cation diffusion facilitator CzcD-associated flavoprotein CzcO
MSQQFEQIIIGAGFAGICMAIKLKEAGMQNFIVLERNSNLGGTWYDNTYPGAACDVQSHLYSYSFELNPNWSMEFSPQQEILNYLEFCAEKYGVKPFLRFNQTVVSARFDEGNSLWQVDTKDGKKYYGASVISCSGGLSQPLIPAFKGMVDFKGSIFHTARWDKSFDLKNKIVAVIGSGASAIQVVPAIAPQVKSLFLFQRTPSWILPKPDKQISAFMKKAYHRFPFLLSFYRKRLYWTHELMAIGFTKNPVIMKAFGKVAKMLLRRSVPDETLRKKVTPDYIIGCKRVLLSNDYYPALQRSNVEVITEGIDHFNERGIITKQGKQYNVDAIVLATGFQAAEGMLVFDVKGRNGLDIKEAWKNGAEAYLGVTVSGFPNFFFIVGPNTGLGHTSMIIMIEAQVNYIMGALKNMRAAGARFIDLKQEALRTFNTDIQTKLAQTVWQSGGCQSWYQDSNGKNVVLWPGFTFTFIKRTRNFEPDKYEIVK